MQQGSRIPSVEGSTPPPGGYSDALIDKARRLANTTEDFEALLARRAVPLSRLDPEWARRYGLLCSKFEFPTYCDQAAEYDSRASWSHTGRLCRRHWYAEYLASDAWERVRERKLREAGRRCERCGKAQGRTLKGNPCGLQVHHRTYERVGGDELLEDLEVLCESCHREEHRK